MPEYLSLTIEGKCAGCGAKSLNMEGDGWVTADYKEFWCPSCHALIEQGALLVIAIGMIEKRLYQAAVRFLESCPQAYDEASHGA